jgi:hypothetical protein
VRIERHIVQWSHSKTNPPKRIIRRMSCIGRAQLEQRGGLGADFACKLAGTATASNLLEKAINCSDADRAGNWRSSQVGASDW